MLIGSRPKLDLVSNNFAVKVDNIPVERVTVYKSLGVAIDEDLTWKAHTEEISKKISAGLLVLKRISQLFRLKRGKSKHLSCPILTIPVVYGDISG